MRRYAKLVFMLACGSVVYPLQGATTINWANSAGNTDWASGASWVGGTAPANDLTTNVASFTMTSAGIDPTLAADRSINGLVINTAAAAWTLSAASGAPTLHLGNGNVNVSGANTATISTQLSLDTSGNDLFNINTGSTIVLSNTVSGVGGIYLNSADYDDTARLGKLVLSGANSFTGAINVDSGTLSLQNNYALGNASSVTIWGFLNGPSWKANLDVSGGVDIKSGGAITLYSSVANYNALTSSSGNNTIENQIHVQGQDTPNYYTQAQQNFNTIANLAGNTTLTLSGGIDHGIFTSSSVSFDGPGNIAVTNTINMGTASTSYASLTKKGTGTLYLSTSNTLGGQVLIQGGAISVNQFNALGSGATTGLTLGSSSGGGMLIYTGSTTDSLARPITLAGAGEVDNNSTGGSAINLNAGVTLAGNTFTVGGSADTNLSGVSGTGNVTKNGSANLNLSGSNAFTGTLTINGGNVNTTVDNTLGSSVTVSLANTANTNFNLDNTNQTIANLQGGGATGGNVQLGNQTLTLASGTGTFAGVISGAGNILINGANQNLTGTNNTYGGTVTIQSGSLAIASPANLSSDSNPVLIESAGTLVLNANSDIPTSIIDPTSTGTVALGADNNQITAIDGNTWLGAGPAGFILSSASLAAGNGNVYRLGGGGGTLTISTGALTDAGATPNSVLIGNAVELDGNNTYTGATTVTGTLTVTNLANAGTASSIGESGVLNLSANAAWFEYDQSTATTASTDTTFNISGGPTEYGGIIQLYYVNSHTMTLNLNGSITSTDDSSLHLWGSNTVGNLSGTLNLGSGANGGILYIDNTGTWNFGSTTGTESVTAGQVQVSDGKMGIGGNVDFNAPVNIIDGAQSSLSTGTSNYSVTFEQGLSTSSSTFTRSGTGLITLNGTSVMNGGSGTFTNSAGNLQVNGTLQGNFTNSGGATIFASTSTLTGNITVSGGTARFADLTTYSTPSTYFPNTKLVISGGVLEGQGTFTRSIGTSNGAFTWTNGGFSAVGGNLTVAVGGTATPSLLTWGSSNFMTVSGATLTFGSASADHTVYFENGVALTGSSVASRTITVNQGVGSTPEVEFDGVISDNSSKAGSLIKAGNGTLLLDAANTYHGGTTIQAGSLFIGVNDISTSGGALGDSTTALTIGNASSGTSNLAFEIYDANVGTNRAITVANDGATVTLGTASANTGTFGGAITLNKSVTLNAATGGTAIFNAPLSDTSSGAASHVITTTGSGDVQLNAANTYTGSIAVQQGRLLVGNSGALGSASSVSIGNASTGTNDSPALLTNGAFTVSRNLTVAAGSGSRTFGGNTNDNSTFSGTTLLNNNVNLTSAATGTKTITISNVISDAGGSYGLTKIGAGNATLTAANTYHGNTTIQAGTLFLSGNGSFANSPQINISSGATLDVTADGTPFLVGSSQSLLGNGNINGNVKLAGNLSGSLSINGNLSGSGAITPGDAPGIITASSLSSSGMKFNFEFTQSGSPDYSDPTNSGNSVLDLTSPTNPFTSALTSSDTINIYLDASAITGTPDLLRGGFFTNDNANFLSEIDGATINYYVENAGGTTSYDGNDYSLLDPSQYNVSLSTVSDTADFAGSGGPITGEVTQIKLTSAVPLPGAAGTGLALLGGIAIRRRFRRI